MFVVAERHHVDQETEVAPGGLHRHVDMLVDTEARQVVHHVRHAAHTRLVGVAVVELDGETALDVELRHIGEPCANTHIVAHRHGHVNANARGAHRYAQIQMVKVVRLVLLSHQPGSKAKRQQSCVGPFHVSVILPYL